MSDHEQELNEEDDTKLKEMFAMMDADGTGYLDLEEITKVYRGFGLNPTKEDMEKEFAKADHNDDGKVDYSEIRRLVMSAGNDRESARDIMEDAVNTTFQKLDTSGNGSISRDELRDYLMNNGQEPLTDDEINELFDDIDSSEDNVITRDELVAYGRKICVR